MLIGDLNINLSGVSSGQAQLLKEFLSAICPLVCNFSATIDSLSNIKFTPKKNYDTNLMEEGLIGTLVNGTLVLFDETTLNTGKIDNFGVENIKSFATLIEAQNIIIDYGYYPLEMPITAPVIILSESRTMFKNSCHVPVTPAQDLEETLTKARQKVEQVLADEETLDQMRMFTLALGIYSETTVSAFSITEDVSSQAQTVFMD